MSERDANTSLELVVTEREQWAAKLAPRKAGRPVAPQRPAPQSWRPETQAQADKWREIGGVRWLRRMLNEMIS